MSIDANKIIERSVDSIQKIYAVVIALAISAAIQTLLKGASASGNLSIQQVYSGIPGFVAFLFTLVPFWHGMNRHLDRCYLEKKATIVQGALLFDFGTFFVEASLLFAAGWLLRSGIHTFECLGLLLCADMLWAFISHQIHFPGRKSHGVRWSSINVITLFVAILVVAFPFNAKPLVLMAIAVLRTVADYRFCWDFYFPVASAQSALSITAK